jgi:hypothetical protein
LALRALPHPPAPKGCAPRRGARSATHHDRRGTLRAASGLRGTTDVGTSSEGLDPLDGLSASDQKSVRSLQARLDEQQAKLDVYIADPDAYNNLGILQAKTLEVRQLIINGRVRHLQTEINTFQSNINKRLGGGS